MNKRFSQSVRIPLTTFISFRGGGFLCTLVETYDFQFDVAKFLSLYEEVVEPYHNSFGPQFNLFFKQLIKNHSVDINGLDVKDHISGYRLSKALKSLEHPLTF